MDQRRLALVANVAMLSVSRIENAHAGVRLDVLMRRIADTAQALRSQALADGWYYTTLGEIVSVVQARAVSVTAA